MKARLRSSRRTLFFWRPNTLKIIWKSTWVVQRGLTDQFDRSGWSLGLDDRRLLGLLGLLDFIFRSFGLLLGDLFWLDSFEILFTESELSYGDVIDYDVEMGSSFREQASNSFGYLISLSQELSSGKLSNYGSQNFVANGWQNFLFVVFTQSLVNIVQIIDFGVEQHLDWQLDKLHVSIGGFSPDFVLASLDIVDDWLLNDGYLEVITFSESIWRQTTQKFVEFDSVMADINWSYYIGLP